VPIILPRTCGPEAAQSRWRVRNAADALIMLVDA
jgi:hypothetical protein